MHVCLVFGVWPYLCTCQGARYHGHSSGSCSSGTSGSRSISFTEDPQDALEPDWGEEYMSQTVTESALNQPVTNPMHPCEVEFWGYELQSRFRTADLTPCELEMLLNHPKTTEERIRMLGNFPAAGDHYKFIAWAGELMPELHAAHKSAGACVPVRSPIWTVLKGVLLSERKGNLLDKNYVNNHCCCCPRTAFMLYGCACQLQLLDAGFQELPFLEGAMCGKCSLCSRCYKLPPQEFASMAV